MRKLLFFTLIFFIVLKGNSQHFKVGLQKDDKSYISSSLTRFPVPLNQLDLPSSASLKPFCPTAGNQIQLNTSPAWAAVYSAMTLMWAKEQNLTNPVQIARSAFSPIFVYHQATEGTADNCDQAVSLPSILDAMASFGNVRYTQFLEFCPETIPDSLLQQARTNRIQGYQRLFHLDDNYERRLLSIKAVLSNGKPVVAGMHSPPSFQSASERWQPREPMNNKWPLHAITIIGFDDQKYGGAFEVLNSWGKKWGNNGFTWIRYQDMVNFLRYGFELVYQPFNNDKITTINARLQLIDQNGAPIALEASSDSSFLMADVNPQDLFQLQISLDKTAFVYAAGLNDLERLEQLYPFEDDQSNIISLHDVVYTIPKQGYFFQQTATSNSDWLILFISSRPLDLMSELTKLNVMVDDFNNLSRKITEEYFTSGLKIFSDRLKYTGIWETDHNFITVPIRIR